MVVPNPGSDKAVAEGCTCAILDNGRGNEELGKSRGFCITMGCPLHDPEEGDFTGATEDETWGGR